MRIGIFFLTAFLFVTISSCKSSKAADFNDSLVRAERRAFEIIVGKEGSGEKKLKYLEKDDYKNALKTVDQQAKEFDSLIADIQKLSTDGIPEGEQLKTASLAYYQSLKELHVYDRKEIEQQALLRSLKDDELKNAQDKLLTLARQKKTLYNAVYEKEALLHTASEAFKTANSF
ncbi:hypothetical protein K6T82_03125 [Flavobacterium sp. 17A]|uniref:Cell-wall binding lipoprotein n=1 Tax=Flavobacterium potami TaxID=2872310 RepID=A0A9X1KQ37_9FLAO|nr:hypothetical protein [Flavobacterium potami]MBZ4033741.1 hypothetical protein [Flavobacterium potami]